MLPAAIYRVTLSRNFEILNVINSRQLGSDLFHAEGRTGTGTDMTKLIVAFLNFENEAKNEC
jgi:hypothetical protein